MSDLELKLPRCALRSYAVCLQFRLNDQLNASECPKAVNMAATLPG
jgi:hypothetical protein